ncbi:MAG: HDIG domain-containing protein [Candidatus Caenarcaniphilales bacterium]|nr:HDIG domain-containing protein [Candidatus Caenarcaniphilales bacterium]
MSKKLNYFELLKTTRGLVLLVIVSSICATLLWYQRILPPVFELGKKSPQKLVNIEERTILDIKATQEEKEKAKKKALGEFLTNPKFVRNNSYNEVSIENTKKFIDQFDKYLYFIEENKPYFLLSKKSTCLLLLLSTKELNEFWDQLIDSEKEINDLYQSVIAEIKRKKLPLQKVKNNINKLRVNFKKSTLKDFNLIQKIWAADLYTISQEEWFQIKPYVLMSARKLLSYGYLGFIDEKLLKEVLNQPSDLTKKEITYIQNVLEYSLRPNLEIEYGSLSKIEGKALMEVEPIWKNIPSHTVIVERGEIITKDKLDMIEQLNLNRKRVDFPIFGEAFWMTLIVMISFCLYVKFERFQLSFRQMLLLSCLVIGASCFVGFFAHYRPAAVPLAAVAMTTGLFFKPSVGFSAGILFGVLCLQSLNINPSVLIPSFVGVVVGTVFGQKAKNRADLTYSGIWLGFSQILSYLLIGLLSEQSIIIPSEIVIQGLSGLITGLLVSSGMPFLESLFSVITRFRLLELSDPNQPTLKKLHDEAPGTYEHTLVVADLAQDAAKKVEADYELVRVGILYHDIGKLHNPQIFIENQFGGPNPHDQMSPAQSAKEIIKHVTEGIIMAKKVGLPETIINFIPMHQGDSRAGHFFLKACQQDPSLNNDKEFRYPGPKPNSKETGIAMLADTVEATIRSLKTDDKELVKVTIKNLIESRVKDSQLCDSTLSKRELEKVAESFYESWKNKNHERIKYISDLKK